MNLITKVNHQRGSYNIYSGAGEINRLHSIIKELRPDNVFLISDTNVFPLYKDKVLYDGKFIIEAGEPSKTLDTVYNIYEEMHKCAITRSSLVVALGGGVVGDIAGFAAATYMRGIRIIQVPTSLLAQIDSSIGGKTGVDTPFGKNSVGSIWQPEAVIADTNFLSTLPKYYIQDGLGEAIKYGCIADAELFDILSSGFYTYDDIIPRCVKIKADIVSRDEFETHERKILNFGHTFGHAIEKCEKYRGLSHGMAVGIGMVIAAQIGEKIGFTEKGVTDEIMYVLHRQGLPISTDIPYKDLIDAIASDKKRKGKSISFILPKKIGECAIVDMEIAQIAEALWVKYEEK